MKQKLASPVLFITSSLMLLFFSACGPVVVAPAEITALTATAPISPGSTDCPPESWPCPSDSMTLTAAMAATLNAIPSKTPPAGVTLVPVVGDLGWGSVYGTITDGNTGRPIEGAAVTCEHFSYTSPYLCKGITTTNSDGIFSFSEVYFHDTDKITLIVEAPGYASLRFEQPGFTFPEFHANLGLFPSDTMTLPTTMPVMCTPVACSDGVLVCGSGDMCPLGCGAVCVPFTPTP